VLHYGSAGYIHAENIMVSKTYEAGYYLLQSVGLQPIPSPTSIDSLIDRAADKYGIRRPLLHALASTESQKNPTALSLKGAIGLLQIMPANYKRCGLSHAGKLWDEATNIDCGALILSQELASQATIGNALRVYNGGPKALKRQFPESEAYVVRVMTKMAESANT